MTYRMHHAHQMSSAPPSDKIKAYVSQSTWRICISKLPGDIRSYSTVGIQTPEALSMGTAATNVLTSSRRCSPYSLVCRPENGGWYTDSGVYSG